MQDDEQAIEATIQAKGLNAPRITPLHIEGTVQGAAYHVFPGTTVTVCCLTRTNGFNVIGHSAAVSPANFDAEVGKRVSYQNAKEQIWQLEGYLLRQRLADATD